MMPNQMIPSKSVLMQMFRLMWRIRLVEEEIAKRYGEDKMKCPTHLSIGQEAIAVGVCKHLRVEDRIYGTHRNHAGYLAKGGDVDAMIAEMYGKETGCARGRGGSMHLIDIERGMLGSSAIVGGALPLPVGSALAFQLQGKDNVGVAFFGDAGIEPGIFHECMNFSALRKLPVIFVCENNDYSTMTLRDVRQNVPIAERAMGYGMPGIRIDGNDVLQVYATAGEAIQRARAGKGPTLIEAVTYRWREHVEHNKDKMSRPAEELAYWKARCPIDRFQREINQYLDCPPQLADIIVQETRRVTSAFKKAEIAPVPQVKDILTGVGDELEPTGPECDPGDRKVSCTEAIAEATVQAMDNDKNVVVFGLHVTDSLGVFGTTKSAFERFGSKRVFETPIMEPAMVGIATGMAIEGLRPLHVHARNDFLLLCMDQIGNQLSKWSYMSGGKLRAPVVIRAIVGRSRGQGCQHSQSLQSVFAHFPGLHVVAPSNGYDAKGLLLCALTGQTPVIYLEHRLCHPMVCAVPEGLYFVPIGKARIRRAGIDVTIVSVLQMVYEAERASSVLADFGISAEVIDLRSIRPWDKQAVCKSVRKTGRLIVADTGWIEFGISAEIASYVTEHEFGSLKAGPVRIGLPPCPTPSSEVLENAYYPGWGDIVASAFRLLGRDLPSALAEMKGFTTHNITGPF